MPELNVLPRTIACSVGIASTLVLDSNPLRKYLVLVNDSDTTLYLALSSEPAVLNSGIRLNANGGSFEINLLNPYHGKINAISSVATKILAGSELSYA